MLREMDDRYLLPYRDRLVTQVRVDYALTLVLEGDASVSVEEPTGSASPTVRECAHTRWSGRLGPGNGSRR